MSIIIIIIVNIIIIITFNLTIYYYKYHGYSIAQSRTPQSGNLSLIKGTRHKLTGLQGSLMNVACVFNELLKLAKSHISATRQQQAKC